MANLSSALQQLRAEQRQAQLHVENLSQAISVIESLTGTGTSRNGSQPRRIISAASRRKIHDGLRNSRSHSSACGGMPKAIGRWAHEPRLNAITVALQQCSTPIFCCF